MNLIKYEIFVEFYFFCRNKCPRVEHIFTLFEITLRAFQAFNQIIHFFLLFRFFLAARIARNSFLISFARFLYFLNEPKNFRTI